MGHSCTPRSFQGRILLMYENRIIANLGGCREFALLRAWAEKS